MPSLIELTNRLHIVNKEMENLLGVIRTKDAAIAIRREELKKDNSEFVEDRKKYMTALNNHISELEKHHNNSIDHNKNVEILKSELEKYNAAVSNFRSKNDELNKIVDEYNKNVDEYNIIAHRPGTDPHVLVNLISIIAGQEKEIANRRKTQSEEISRLKSWRENNDRKKQELDNRKKQLDNHQENLDKQDSILKEWEAKRRVQEAVLAKQKEDLDKLYKEHARLNDNFVLLGKEKSQLLEEIKKAGSFYELAESSIKLSAPVLQIIESLAADYFSVTNKKLIITSGTRTPGQQASAMYYKLKNGEDIVALYANKDAAREVKNAYENNKTKPESAILAAMTEVITQQVARGVFLSRHLQEGGFDVRNRDMTDQDKAAFKAAVAKNSNLVLLDEGVPPHFHVHLKDLSPHLAPSLNTRSLLTNSSLPFFSTPRVPVLITPNPDLRDRHMSYARL